MQEKNSNSSDSVKAILDKISGKTSSSKSSDFNFGDKGKSTSRKPSGVKFESADKPAVKKTEYSFPDKYNPGPKYNSVSASATGNTPRITTTYVPKFTGASLNYRMLDDPRAKVSKPASKSVSTSSIPATAEYKEDIDPTSEFEEVKAVPDAVQVKPGIKDEPQIESASLVFKFETEKPDPAESLPLKEDSESEQSLIQEEAEEEKTELPEEPKEYKIPDPTDLPAELTERTVSSSIAANSVLEDSFNGVGNDENIRCAKEYTSYSQRDSFKDRFIDTIMSVYVRFFAALIITVIAGVVEIIFAAGVDIPRILNLAGVPGAMALFDLQFVLCLYLLALPETILAVKCLIRRKVVPELFLSASFVVLIIYTLFITFNSPKEYALFGLIFGIFALSAISASYFKTFADFTAFKRVSKNGEKTVIDNSYTRNLEKENAALDGAVEEHKSKTARTFRTLFTSDFFGRSAVCEENSYNLLLILGVSFGASIVVGLIALFIPGGWVNAITAFTLVFMLSCPAMSIMVHKVPYFHASREAELEKSAIIGEKSLYLYSGIDVITFEDTEVFGPEDVTLQRIMLYGRSDNLSKALRQMAALFMNVGGPLDVLFSGSLDRKCAPAQSVEIESNGVCGKIDGDTIMAGTMDYMLIKGARIPAEEAAQEKLHNSTKVMYAAENGVVYAKFHIRYSFSEDFTMLLPILEDAKIKPLVYTRDPNVTNQLISVLTAGSDKIRIMKKYDTLNGEVIYRKASVGMMTGGDKSNVVNMILLAKKYENLQSRFGLAELIAMASGGLFAAVLAILGIANIPSVALAAFQIAWCGVLHFMSAISFRLSKSKKR